MIANVLATRRSVLRPLSPGHEEELHGLWTSAGVRRYLWSVIGYWFDVVGMPVIRASTDAPNVASARVLEKLQFALVRQATVNGLDTLFYERRSHGLISRHTLTR